MNWLLGLFGATASLLLKPPSINTGPRHHDQPSAEGLVPRTMLTFEETVAQMHRGYENTQRVVQAMDTKAGAVVALCLAILAFTGTLVAWLYENLGDGFLQKKSAPHCCLTWTLIVLVLAVGFTGFACLDRSFKTVRPNGLPDPKHFTTLFPVAENAWKDPNAIRHLRCIAAGESQLFVLQEFQEQLLAMGSIVYLKIKHLRQSITCLWWQGFFAILLSAVIGTAAVFGLIVKTNDIQQPIPVSFVPSSGN